MSSPAEHIQWPSPDIFHDSGLSVTQELYVKMITILNFSGETHYSHASDGARYSYTASAVVESYETEEDTKTHALQIRETPIVTLRAGLEGSDRDGLPSRVFTLYHGRLRDELPDLEDADDESHADQFEWQPLMCAVIEQGDELGAEWGTNPETTESSYISLLDAANGRELTSVQQGHILQLLDAMFTDLSDQIATFEGTEALVKSIRNKSYLSFEDVPVLLYCDQCSGSSTLCIHNVSQN